MVVGSAETVEFVGIPEVVAAAAAAEEESEMTAEPTGVNLQEFAVVAEEVLVVELRQELFAEEVLVVELRQELFAELLAGASPASGQEGPGVDLA